MIRASILLMALAAAPVWGFQQASTMKTSIDKLTAGLTAKYGAGERARIAGGLSQMSRFWTPEDGAAPAFEAFALEHYAGSDAARAAMLGRFEKLLEQFDGHMLEISLAFRTQTDLDLGPVQPYDEIFAGYEPGAHAADDFFRNKLAFAVLLNFPLTTLDQRLKSGETWSRQQWAEARLAARFSRRAPARVNLAIAEAGAKAEQYIAQYNIWMRHVLDERGQRLFPPKMRLLAHWNLRDQIKADYSEKDGIARQRVIAKVMDHIVKQTIPKAVIDNPAVDWNPFTNAVTPTTEKDHEPAQARSAAASAAPEPDTRYATLLANFRALRQLDPYSPTAPTHMARVFEEERELPEARVRQMFERVLASPLVPKVAALIEKRLGRPLEPFDVWYSGFKPRGESSEAQLDAITRAKYPTPEAYHQDMPRMFEQLGFPAATAQRLAAAIVVDPARGSGHAWGAQLSTAPAHLRTRVAAGGMDYKGYNIAVHEMGHNVEQTFSLRDVDHWLLNGVPNTAFTEAIAFVFQSKDMELLGLHTAGPQDEALRAINDFWATYEIAGVAMVDMDAWHWMYAHPNATPAQLKQAVLEISRKYWNLYYAPVFRHRDVTLLGVYSHMIERYLYLPDYPIGHLIAHQLEEHFRQAGKVGPEVERVAKQGRLAPDLWMKGATGAPVGPDALLAAAARALASLQ